MMRRKTLIFGFGLTALTLILWGLAAAVIDLNPRRAWPESELSEGRNLPQGDFYRCGFPEVGNTNPYTTTEGVARRYVLAFSHDTLMDLDPVDGSLRPALAESIESISERELLVTLRPQVQWSDGKPLGMDDLVWSLTARRAVNPDAEPAIEEFTALDERRCRIVLAQPHFAALPKFACNFVITQAAWFRDQLMTEAKASSSEDLPQTDSPVFRNLLRQVRRAGPGTGAYQIGRFADGTLAWVAGDGLTLVSNQSSWRRQEQAESWNLSGIDIRFVTDRTAQLAMVRERQLDWIAVGKNASELRSQWPILQTEFELHQYDNPQVGSYFILWNHRHEQLSDPRVRRALTMLFDRETIVQNLFGDTALVPASWFRPDSPEVPKGAKPLPFDPEGAKALLREVGINQDNPLRLRMVTPQAPGIFRSMLEIAHPVCEQLGVQLEMITADQGQYLRRLDDRDFDGILRIRYHDLWIDPYPVFAAPNSLFGYQSKEADRILKAARSEQDDATRYQLYHRFHEIFQQDQPITLLAYPLNQILLHRRFQSVRPGPMGLSPEHWWVRPQDQIVK